MYRFLPDHLRNDHDNSQNRNLADFPVLYLAFAVDIYNLHEVVTLGEH